MPPRSVLLPVGLTLAGLLALGLLVTPGQDGPPGDLLLTIERAASTLQEVAMK